MAVAEKKTKIILIGRSTAGKTTLCQRVMNQELSYHKTQTVTIMDSHMIDTPGEYLERRGFRGALMVSSVEADLVIFVQDALEKGTMFPPSFSSMFAKPCIGVITKIDMATKKQVEDAEQFLKMAGADQIYRTSSVTGEGIDALVADLHI